ncbi:MAG TPA: hypothetical protein VHC90_02790 [Bryobacteraceae bacterium]|nr:hypothetical protein [Bryobacteraceae bacterium]
MERALAGTVLLFGLGACLHGQQTPDPLIVRAREFAQAYSRSLPDYVVTRDTSRYTGTVRVPGSPVGAGNWRLMDTISGDLTVRHGVESYGNLRRNGKPTEVLTSGVWSTGEFASELLTVLAPERNAKFKADHSETLGTRQAERFRFSVDQRHSNWILTARSLVPKIFRDSPALTRERSGSILPAEKFCV